MIPYDDLVAALTAWRARQGLPVTPSAADAPPRGRAAPATPPAAAPRTAPRPAAPVDASSGDFEDALVEESYDGGEDYVMQLGAETSEPTAIGSAPAPPRGKRPW